MSDRTGCNTGGVPPASGGSAFGALVRRYRRRLGLSQERLAERAELSPRALSYLESGKHRPYPATTLRLADALGLAGEEREAFLRTAEVEDSLGKSDPSASLPGESTPFIGREREIALVLGLLRQPDIRLLTLAGPGGIGKTRLAIQIGRLLTSPFVADVTFVSLAAVQSPGLVASTIVRALGAPDDGRPAIDVLIRYLGDRKSLLILDNFEHLVEGSQIVADLIAACPRLRLLVTSRRVLRLTAEHVFDVSPLSTPEADTLLGTQELLRYDAVALFAARARARVTGFVLSPENAAVVAAICRHLDGMPLAIELAASRVSLFSPAALLARLTYRLPLLSGGPQDLPERQQSLRRTIDWSFELLSAPEQTLFAGLSAFQRGCTLNAVEAVCAPDRGPMDVLEELTSLIDKSLVRRVESLGGEPRFGMLETIREYASERLLAAGEKDAVQRRHAEYFARLAEEIDATFVSSELYWPLPRDVLAVVDDEEDNLWSALMWAVERTEVALGLRLAPALIYAWGNSSRPRPLTELHDILGSLLATQGEIPPATRAQALRVASMAAPDVKRGRRMLDDSISLCREIGDKQGLLRLLLFGPGGAGLPGQMARCREGLALAYELDATNAIGILLRGLGFIEQSRGNLERARLHLEESLVAELEHRNELGAAKSRHSLAWLALLDGHPDRAQELAPSIMPAYRADGTFLDMLNLHSLVAIAAFLQGDYAALYTCFHESTREPRLFFITRYVSQWLYLLAAARSADSAAEEAARLLGAADAGEYRIEETALAAFRDVVAERLAFGRAQVDDAAWNGAWQQGRSMTFQEAWSSALTTVPLAGATLS